MTKPYVLTNQNSPAFWMIDNLWMPLAGSTLTSGSFTLLEQICGTGIGGPPTHYHPTDEGLFVIDGHCTFHAGGVTLEAGPGDFVSIPRLTPHSFSVDVPGSRLLNFYTPAGFEDIIMSLAIPAPERKAPKAGESPMPPPWMVEETSREFGQIPVLGLPFRDPLTDENSGTTPSELNLIKPFGSSILNAPAFWSQDSLFTILASKEQTGGAYSLMHQVCPQRSGPPPHTHLQDEVLYLLNGTLTLLLGDRCLEVNEGSLAFIPKHTVHSFRIDSDSATLLNWYLPGGFEETISRFGVAAEHRGLPPLHLPQKGTPDQMMAHFDRIGMTAIAVPDFLRKP